MDYFKSPASLATQLEAVNALLQTIDQSPVSVLDPSPSSDVDQALQTLDAVDLEVQSEGWSWNREFAFPLTLGTDGHVAVPDQTLWVARAYYPQGDKTSMNFVQRGAILYDQDAHTYTFTAAPVVDMIVRLPWDLTPQPYRSYLVLRAAQRFHAEKQGVGVVLQVKAQDIAKARTVLEQREDEVDDLNTVSGNQGVQAALYGTGGLRRNRRGL